MKVYISGPITGTTDYMERFAVAERELTAAGHTVVNPARVNAGLPEETTHAEYMKMSLDMMDMCDTVFVLAGWQNSVGCNMEIAHAIEQKMTIAFEGGKECPRANRPERETLPQRQGMKFISAIMVASSAK